MAMTYNTLVNQVLSYLNRNDGETQAQIPNFILQAEQRIASDSKMLGLEVYVLGNFTPGNPYLQKPARWRRNLSFNCGTGVDFNTMNQLYLRSCEYIRNYWPNADKVGEPLYYADYGYNNLIVCPTPEFAYPFEYCYLQLPEALTSQSQTNWITENAPSLILYATLLESVPFLKNYEDVPVWTQYYQAALESLNNQDDMRLLDRASNRMAD